MSIHSTLASARARRTFVGIALVAGLVAALLAALSGSARGGTGMTPAAAGTWQLLRSDAEIAGEIRDEVIASYLGCDLGRAGVTVTDGIVTLAGEVERKSMVPLAERMARSVDGVVDVVNRLAYALDDAHLPTATELDGV